MTALLIAPAAAIVLCVAGVAVFSLARAAAWADEADEARQDAADFVAREVDRVNAGYAQSPEARQADAQEKWEAFAVAKDNYWRNDTRRDLRTHADLSGESAWDWLCYGAAFALLVGTAAVLLGNEGDARVVLSALALRVGSWGGM